METCHKNGGLSFAPLGEFTRSLKWQSNTGQMITFLQMAADGRKEFTWHLL